MILGIMHSKDVSMGTPLLARGRDRLEMAIYLTIHIIFIMYNYLFCD